MADEGKDEILALVSIYEDKLRIEEQQDGKQIGITIHPATADDSASQYVCLDMSLAISAEYPREAPQIKFSKSRGLSDVSLDDLRNRMEEFVREREGECVLFDLLEMAKDTLTYNNIPSCLCPICLSGFEEGDEFLKTDCYHYFHCYCLNQYKNHLPSETDDIVENKNNKRKHMKKPPPPSPTITISCPVCRLPVIMHVKMLEQAKSPLDSHDYQPDKALLQRRKEKYEKIYEKQLQNGGLIDLEYEQNKYLLSNIQKAYKNQQESTDHESLDDGTAAAVERKPEQDKNPPSISTNHAAHGRSRGHKGAVGHGFKNYSRHHHYRDLKTSDSSYSGRSHRGRPRAYFTKPKSKPDGNWNESNKDKAHKTDFEVFMKDSKSATKLSNSHMTESKERVGETTHADKSNTATDEISVVSELHKSFSEGSGNDFKKENPGHVKGIENGFRGGRRYPHRGRGRSNHFYRHDNARSPGMLTEKQFTSNPHSNRTYRPIGGRGRLNSAKYRPGSLNNHKNYEQFDSSRTVMKKSEG